MNRWQRVDGAIERVEQTLLVTLLGFIILLAFLQIFLRNFLSTGGTAGLNEVCLLLAQFWLVFSPIFS